MRAGHRRAWALRVLLLSAGAVACGRGAAFDGPAVVRGHADLRMSGDGRVVPLAVDRGTPLGLCLEVPQSRDTSAWRAVLTFDGRESPEGLALPAARIGHTVCFEGRLPEGQRPSPAVNVCGRVVDAYDGAGLRLPCRRVAFDPAKAEARRELMQSRAALLAREPDRAGALVADLDALAQRAASRGLPMLAANLQLIAVHALTREGTPDALQAAGKRLRELPGWLESPEASGIGAVAALQRAELHLAAGPDYGRAWASLAEAERRFLRVARPERFTVTMKQAAILSRMGETGEAVRRLRTSLADCDARPCDAELLAQARSELAWMVSLDPDATASALADAEADLEAARARLPAASYPLEHAVQVVNLAYLQLRRGKDPRPLLDEAGHLLRRPAAAGAQTSHLLDWVQLFEGLHALAAGLPLRLPRAAQGPCGKRGIGPRLQRPAFLESAER